MYNRHDSACEGKVTPQAGQGSWIESKGRPHILMLVRDTGFPPSRNAPASRLGSFAKYWGRLTTVSVICSKYSPPTGNYSRYKFPLTKWRLDFLRLPYLFPRLLRLVKSLDVDVVFASFPYSWELLEAYLLASRLGAPFILDIRDLPEAIFSLKQGSLLRRLFNFWMRCMSNYLARKAVRIATVTNWLRGDLIKALNYPPGEISVVRNGSEVALFQKAFSIRKKFDLVYSGSFSTPFRNTAAILRYLRHLTNLHPSLRVLFISDFNTSLGGKFLAAVKSQGLDNNLVVKSMVPLEQLPERMGCARLGFCSFMPGDNTRCGVASAKMYDYLAAGLPVIGLLDPDFYLEARRLIADNDVGILHPDPERLAEETVALLKSPSRLRKMSTKAREVGERFDRRRLAEDYFYSVILPAWKEHNPNRDE